MTPNRDHLRELTINAYINRHPLTFGPTDGATFAIERLVNRDVSGAPVVDEHNRVVGFLSAKDCMLAVRGALYFGLPPRFVVGDLMTHPVETIGEGATLVHAAELFSTRPYRRMPVVDASQRLVGVLRRHHVLAAYLAQLQSMVETQGRQATVRH